MKGAIYTSFRGPILIEQLPDPTPTPDSVIIKVEASGLCRSDWHGWQGHDSDIHLPHVPGHELAGIVAEVGNSVKNWKTGDRVTVPFCGGCGYCTQCQTGNQQVCDNYFQPGFTGWGSFATYVMIRYADHNLVRIPESMDFDQTAVLGCRFMTAYRGLIAQGKLAPGQWVAVFGCGGVGLSAIAIAHAMGCPTVAVDINQEALELAGKMGATHGINTLQVENVPELIKAMTLGGAHVSIDALGSAATCVASIQSLRKRGRHIQIGLMTGPHKTPAIPMPIVIANELEIIGSHGMQAHQYPEMLQFIINRNIPIAAMIGKRIHLNQLPDALSTMDEFRSPGVTVVTTWE